MRISLCLLTWNELAGCKADIPHLPLDQFEEVFAIDGGSRDGTVEYLREQAIPIYQQGAPGYNNAYQSAFSRCSTDALIFYHPKGTIDPLQLLEFRPRLENGYELVIASRMINGAVNEEDYNFLRPRKWFVLGLAALAALIWRRQGPIIWDVLHGMRAMKASTFADLRTKDAGVAIDLAMVIRSYRANLSVCEFAVVEQLRVSGNTHFPALKTGWRIIRFMLSEITERSESVPYSFRSKKL